MTQYKIHYEVKGFCNVTFVVANSRPEARQILEAKSPNCLILRMDVYTENYENYLSPQTKGKSDFSSLLK